MADSADHPVPGNEPVSRSARSKRRATTPSSGPSSTSPVSPDTENKLARAAQSAQRFAQLTDVPHDDSTLDLFPDDPTRALVQAMEIDTRQGTLSGFELPDVVLAAVEAAQGSAGQGAVAPEPAPRRPARTKSASADSLADSSSAGAVTPQKPAKRVGNGNEGGRDASAVADAPVPGGGPVAAQAGDDGGRLRAAPVAGDAVSVADVAGGAPHPASAAEDKPVRNAEAEAPVLPGRAASQARAAAAAAAASVGNAASAVRTGARTASVPGGIDSGSAQAERALGEASAVGFDRQAAPPRFATNFARAAAAAELAGETGSAAVRAPLTSPELDRARATAFADTVDALYGVIADQRRAAADLSRRMKWMLSVVAVALLATVGVVIAQTWLLSRLARDASAQQQRIEQMIEGQQAALAGMLDRLAAPPMASAVAASEAAAVPPAAAPAPPPAPAATRHASKKAHSHRPKAVSAR